MVTHPLAGLAVHPDGQMVIASHQQTLLCLLIIGHYEPYKHPLSVLIIVERYVSFRRETMNQNLMNIRSFVGNLRSSQRLYIRVFRSVFQLLTALVFTLRASGLGSCKKSDSAGALSRLFMGLSRYLDLKCSHQTTLLFCSILCTL